MDAVCAFCSLLHRIASSRAPPGLLEGAAGCRTTSSQSSCLLGCCRTQRVVTLAWTWASSARPASGACW